MFLLLFVLIFFLGIIMGTGKIGFDFRSRALYVPANITVDTSTPGAPVNLLFYHAFAQGGEEMSNSFAGLEKSIASYRPKLIRIDHLYDYLHIVSRGPSGLVFDFSALDAVLDSIRASGAAPLVSLSYMPPAIAADGNLINAPLNWGEWSWVVQKTIEHTSSATAGVYYEIWNEPDHPQFGGWKTYGTKNYLTLYHYAAVGAQNAKNVLPFKLGGPATTALYHDWVSALLSSGDRVDFLTWHTYSTDPVQYKKELEYVRDWAGHITGMVKPELLITEFGFSPAKDKRYGTYFAAAHTAAVVRALIDNPPTYVFSFEVKDGPLESAGSGWGMWTYDKKPKLRLSVFPLLDSMSGNRLFVSGEGSRVTAFATIDGSRIQVLLVNYDQTEASESFPVTFLHLTPGTYTLTYRRMIGPTQKVAQTIQEPSFTQLVYMPANGVMVLELEPSP
jgi:hypothetical protein